MTETALAQLVKRRQQQKKRILANPAGFKVCSVCTSIATRDAPWCPLRKAYRFVEDPLIVEVVTTFASKKPFPITAAVAPRIKPPEPAE
jgi:hypothetical protein